MTDRDATMAKPCRIEMNNSGSWKLLGRFDAGDDNSAVELRVQAVLAGRRKANASGQGGEDVKNIRAAIAGEMMPGAFGNGGTA